MKTISRAEWLAGYRQTRPHLAELGPRMKPRANAAQWPSAVVVEPNDARNRIAGFESAAERDAFVKAHRAATAL